jgi:hypothetical protein
LVNREEIKIFTQTNETDKSNTMVRLYGRLSVDGPVAANRYRQKNGMGGGGSEIIITQNPVRLSVAIAASPVTAPVADNMMKVQPTRVMVDERQQFMKLGKLIYTTTAGDTFTAYHSVVFPKIVNEVDKIVYDNKNSWYAAMRVAAPIRCD